MKLNIGRKITEYRTKTGMTQQEFSEKMNVSRSTVSSWERDRTEPKMGEITLMCQLFGCKVSDFLSVELEKYYEQMTSEQKERLLSYARFLLEEGK